MENQVTIDIERYNELIKFRAEIEANNAIRIHSSYSCGEAIHAYTQAQIEKQILDVNKELGERNKKIEREINDLKKLLQEKISKRLLKRYFKKYY